MEQTDMPQISRWADSQSYRQAAGATGSWSDRQLERVMLRKRPVPLHQSCSRGPSQQRHFSPERGSPLAGLANSCISTAGPEPPSVPQTCWPARRLTHIRDARTRDLKSYTSIWIHRPGQDRGGCSPFQSTLSLRFPLG